MGRNSIEVSGVNAGYMLVQDEGGKLYRHSPDKPIPKGMIAIIPMRYAGLQRTESLPLQKDEYEGHLK